MKVLAISLIGLFLTMAGCKKSANTPESSIALHHCLQAGAHISLCFDSVVTESRCPVNAECVWAGYAACAFTLTHGDQQRSFVLATNNLMPGYAQDTVLLGCSVHLSDLFPYPGSGPAPVKAKVIFTH